LKTKPILAFNISGVVNVRSSCMRLKVQNAIVENSGYN